jgi:hypothetical protein
MEKKKQYLTARKKHHVIYRTTCLTTGRYYIGMHSTDNLADGYMGSGKRLWQSFKKHELHVSEILEELPSREALRQREAELVNEQCLADQQCMNIALGGYGGWEHVARLRSHEDTMRASKIGNEAFKAKLAVDPTLRQKLSDSLAATNRKWTKIWNKTSNKTRCIGMKASEQTKAKMSVSHTGSKNAMFGTAAYIKGGVRKHFKLGEQPAGWVLYTDIVESLKDKTNSAYGKSWYTDGLKNYLLNPDDTRVATLTKGRNVTAKAKV